MGIVGAAALYIVGVIALFAGVISKIVPLGVLGLLLIPIAGALGGRAIGRRTGSGGLGLILGVLFGLIGWLIMAVIVAVAQPKAPRTASPQMSTLEARWERRQQGTQRDDEHKYPGSAEAEPPQFQAGPSPEPSGRTAAERLAELTRLWEAGLLTEEEYQAKRAEIIGQL